MNIDEIVASSKTENVKKEFNKDEWIKKKNEERNEVYSLIDKTALEIMKDSNKFKDYLDIQSHFDKYSVANGLLIYAQMPNATQLREYSEWKAIPNFQFNGKQEGISLLKMGEPYTKKDGSQFTPFVVYKMFDISQTNLPKRENYINRLDDKVLLKAFIHDNPVDIKVEDVLANGECVEWNSDENLLYIQRGAEPIKLYQGIAREVSRAEMESDNKTLDNFKAKCASYMICKKQGLDVSNYNFNDIPESFKNLSSKDIRKELGDIKGSVEDFNNRINQFMESISKQTKNKDYER
jgi:hypothetical protein